MRNWDLYDEKLSVCTEKLTAEYSKCGENEARSRRWSPKWKKCLENHPDNRVKRKTKMNTYLGLYDGKIPTGKGEKSKSPRDLSVGAFQKQSFSVLSFSADAEIEIGN